MASRVDTKFKLWKFGKCLNIDASKGACEELFVQVDHICHLLIVHDFDEMVLHVSNFEGLMTARVIRSELFSYHVFSILLIAIFDAIKLITVALDITEHAQCTRCGHSGIKIYYIATSRGFLSSGLDDSLC